MSVPLMISEEEILAVSGINLFPIFERQLNGRKRRMCVVLVFYAVLIQECQDFLYSFIHIVRYFANMFICDAKVVRKISIFA